MKTWDTQDTIMLSIGIGFGLMMIIGGIYSGVGLLMAVPLVAFLYNRNMKNLNKLISEGKIKIE